MVTSETNEDKVKSFYPRLMSSDKGRVVLFVQPNRGTIVHAGDRASGSLGYFSDDWDMTRFKSYNGEVILKG